jgi:hypothetical protein
MIKLGKYGPALVALTFAGLTALSAALTDGRVDRAEGVQLAIQVATAAGVWLVPVAPSWLHAKTGIAVVLAALNVAVTEIAGPVTWATLVNLALAGLGVIAVRLTVPPDPAVIRLPMPSQRLT